MEGERHKESIALMKADIDAERATVKALETKVSHHSNIPHSTSPHTHPNRSTGDRTPRDAICSPITPPTHHLTFSRAPFTRESPQIDALKEERLSLEAAQQSQIDRVTGQLTTEHRSQLRAHTQSAREEAQVCANARL